MLTVQLLPFVLVQAPDQPLKYERAVKVSLGEAKSVSDEPLANWVEQVPDTQDIPEGLLLTLPVPFPDKVTDKELMAIIFE